MWFFDKKLRKCVDKFKVYIIVLFLAWLAVCVYLAMHIGRKVNLTDGILSKTSPIQES